MYCTCHSTACFSHCCATCFYRLIKKHNTCRSKSFILTSICYCVVWQWQRHSLTWERLLTPWQAYRYDILKRMCSVSLGGSLRVSEMARSWQYCIQIFSFTRCCQLLYKVVEPLSAPPKSQQCTMSASRLAPSSEEQDETLCHPPWTCSSLCPVSPCCSCFPPLISSHRSDQTHSHVT